MRICLYFGSFNPFHVGHYSLAKYMMQTYKFDKLLFVLSPLNPQKKSNTMLPFAFRHEFLQSCIADNEDMAICSIEQQLPEPHYSVRTLTALRLLMPEAKFSMLIGADNLLKLNTWYAYERLADFTDLYVYPRKGYDLSQSLGLDYKGTIHLCENVPTIDVSSSEIRVAIQQSKDLSSLLPIPSLWQDLVRRVCQNFRFDTPSF